MKSERGGFVIGVVVGLLVGLTIALGVALYITKAPVPFVNKVPLRTPEQDQAEQARNRNRDPNAPLAGKNGKPSSPQAASPTVDVAAPGALPPAPAPTRDPARILAGGATPAAPAPAPASAARSGEPFVFFVQTGAYTRSEEAEQQRAKLALLGQSARITEREQNGRVVYRVRLGPFEVRSEAEGVQRKLQETPIDSQLVRVERP